LVLLALPLVQVPLLVPLVLPLPLGARGLVLALAQV
jgi:hypothetical protein